MNGHKGTKGTKVANSPNVEHHGFNHKIRQIVFVSNKVYYILFIVYVIIGFLSIKKINDEYRYYEKEKITNTDANITNFIISITMFFLYIIVGSCYFTLGHTTNH